MKGDFTRETFNNSKHFSRVLMQQGRVLLDADFNEQSAILLHYLRTLTADLFGPYKAIGSGFDLKKAQQPDQFILLKGHCYVAGILVENEADQPSTHTLKGGKHLFYLDVWEHHITPIEDDSIREKALGGPDSSTRSKVVWKMRTHLVEDKFTLESFGGFVDKHHPSQRGSLSARVDPGRQHKNPCLLPPSSKYRGNENQFYRVEIHHDGKKAGHPTFKWSRDNGSVATALLGSDEKGLHVRNVKGFSPGNWVEVADDHLASDSEHGKLVKIAQIDGDTLLVDPTTLPPPWKDHLVHPHVRRWDTNHTADGTVPIQDFPSGEGWIDLEDGIQVRFNSDGEYRSGDWWWFVARVSTGQIEWPDSSEPTETARPPFGINHYYAPLALVNDKLELQNLMPLFDSSKP